MTIIGLNQVSYWISWFFTAVIFSLVNSIFYVLFGSLTEFDFFMNTPSTY